MSSSNATIERLALPDSLTVRAAVDVRDLVLQALETHPAVELQIPEQASIDLSFIQIVEAARLYSHNASKSLSLSRPADGALLAVLERGGIVDGMTPHDKQFWLHQGDTQ